MFFREYVFISIVTGTPGLCVVPVLIRNRERKKIVIRQKEPLLGRIKSL